MSFGLSGQSGLHSPYGTRARRRRDLLVTWSHRWSSPLSSPWAISGSSARLDGAGWGLCMKPSS